jgi:hypothetical protein
MFNFKNRLLDMADNNLNSTVEVDVDDMIHNIILLKNLWMIPMSTY